MRSYSNPDTEVSGLKNETTYSDQIFYANAPHRHQTTWAQAMANAACTIDLRRAQQAKNMPRGTSAPHTHAEHAWSTVRSRPRAPASRGPLRPLHRMKARAALCTRICGVFLGSKMRPRNVLRQMGQQASIANALWAGNMWATERPSRARC
jgi:hypothetical protein